MHGDRFEVTSTYAFILETAKNCVKTAQFILPADIGNFWHKTLLL